MKARMFQRLILATGLTAMVGCACKQPGTKESCSPRALAQPFVFYDETGDLTEGTRVLSETEVQKIIAWVATQTTDRVWLIRAIPWIGEDKHGSAVAYLVPDEATPRIRAGRAYNVPVPEEQTAIYSPWRYAQVSLPNHNFTAELAKPPATEMPFEWPTNSQETSPMSKEEVIAIADFVRNPSSYQHLPMGPEEGWAEVVAHGIFESPIRQMRRGGDLVWVEFGFMHRTFWGTKVNVEIQCTPGEYKVLQRGASRYGRSHSAE